MGIPGDFRGVIDRRDGTYWRYTRTARGSKAAPEDLLDAAAASKVDADWWDEAMESCALLDGIGADVDTKSFLAGESTPVFVGSALTNFGVRLLLDAVIDLAPAPAPRDDVNGQPRRLDAPFSGFVFKVQANMDPAHRDRVAFVRVCSGRFERGVVTTHADSGKPFATKYATAAFGAERTTIDEAYPGDVIGLVNATDLRVGDTLYEAEPVCFPHIPSFAPEVFAHARPVDTGRTKQFRRGLTQLDEEGVIQLLYDPAIGEATPLLAAVGPMQFEVFSHRLANEFGADVELRPTRHSIARRTRYGFRRGPRRDRRLRRLFPSRRQVVRIVRKPLLAPTSRERPPRPAPRTHPHPLMTRSMDELTCPRCGTDEHLSGQRADDVIHITCTRWGLTWDRDTSPHCASCGDSDVRTITEPVIEKARGTQLSIVGVTTRYLCPTCYERDYLNRDYRHIPPGQNPAE